MTQERQASKSAFSHGVAAVLWWPFLFVARVVLYPIRQVFHFFDSRPKLKNVVVRGTKELWLVISFLLALVIFVFVIVRIPPHVFSGDVMYSVEEALDFKREVFAIFLTAFGAWIGAGAAYFFGRENLEQAVKSVKKAKTVNEILTGTKIHSITLRAAKFIVGPKETIDSIATRIWDDRREWFFILTDSNGDYVATIHEEEVWRLRSRPDEFFSKQNWDALSEKEIWIIFRAMAVEQKNFQNLTNREPTSADFALIKSAFDIAESFSPEDSIQLAERTLADKEKYIGVVIDQRKRPTGYFTTGDIRHILTGRRRRAL